MTVPDGKILQAVATFTTTTGVDFQNRFTWETDFATPQSEAAVLAAIAAGLGDLYSTVDAWVHPSLDDPPVEVDILHWVVDQWEVEINVGATVAPTAPSNLAEILPFQTTACLVGRTARPRSRGRKFLLPFGEDAQSGSGWLAAVQTDLADALLELLTVLVVSAGNELIPGVPREAAQVFLPYVSGLISDFVRTQRRRTPGVGT